MTYKQIISLAFKILSAIAVGLLIVSIKYGWYFMHVARGEDHPMYPGGYIVYWDRWLKPNLGVNIIALWKNTEESNDI